MSQPAVPTPRRDDDEALDRALDRGVRVLARSQRPDGSWDRPGHVGAWLTAQAVVVLRRMDRLADADAAIAAGWLSRQQLPDGSWGVHPFARAGDLGATATAWAALHVSGAGARASSLARARAWVEAHGGARAVVALLDRGDLSAVYLALAGLVDAHELPCPHTAPLAVPGVMGVLATRFHVGVFQTAVGLELVVKRLRGGLGWAAPVTVRLLMRLLGEFQNPDGSWNDSSVLTVFALAALWAVGRPGQEMLERGVQWLQRQWVRDVHGMHLDGFGTEVWSTAFDARAWMTAGGSVNAPALAGAMDWLLMAQQPVPMPAVNNRQPQAPKSGGWAFQRTNVRMPDCDDTAVALTALGHALAQRPEVRWRTAARRGRDWLLGMQNPDGGWSAFVWGLPGKRPGPTLEAAPHISVTQPLSLLEAWLEPPASFGDPSTEDVTGRVLQALGTLGLRAQDAGVARAIQFLELQQCPSGAWWGRWVVNYVAATAFALRGLAAVGVDPAAPSVKRGVAWLVARQNADGGWGEGPESYRTQALAGVGPSVAPLTGLVLQALVDVGQARGPNARRGVSFLLATQRGDGTWPNGEYLHTNVPPDTFYVYEEPARFYPTEGLALYRKALARPPPAASKWTDALLDGMRERQDPTADTVIAELASGGGIAAANAVLMSLFRTDEAVPPGLPGAAARYFEQTAVLPAWADAEQIALAQALFARAGWSIAAALFCSSLPQAYAAAKGARVLLQTQGMTKHVRQRVFETAQFLFDALDTGALGPMGRGVRAAQKVRLMHAGIRHWLQTSNGPPWDAAALGRPINQEDLAGTLMTFSVVVLDALERLGVAVSAEEGEAWLHAWTVVGHLLGLVPEMVPADVADAQRLMDAIRTRQWEASQDGQLLAAALADMMDGFLPTPALAGLPAVVMRHLAGDHCGDLLALPAARWPSMLGGAAELFGRFEGRDVTERLLALWTHAIMKAVVSAQREGKQARFRIPVNLVDAVDPRF
jgi:squalene cyclase